MNLVRDPPLISRRHSLLDESGTLNSSYHGWARRSPQGAVVAGTRR